MNTSKKVKNIKKSTALFLSLASLLLPAQTLAFSFDKNYIISDAEMTNKSSMTKGEVRSFLSSKGSALATHKTTDVDGKQRYVSDIISNVSKRYELNPMLFLVLAQKESGAVTSSRVTTSMENWILGFGYCDSCTAKQAATYKGIANQFDSAGWQFRNRYLADLESRGTTRSGWAPGKTKTTADGIAVTPQNNATAALYTYNPWVGAYGGGDRRYGANSLFSKLWQEWNITTENINYPSGTLLQNNNIVYLIQNDEKRQFTSKSALLTNYANQPIIKVPKAVLEKYDDGAPISFPNFSVLETPDSKLYLIVNDTVREFEDRQSFKSTGFQESEIIKVDPSAIVNYKIGKNISSKQLYPSGAIVKNEKTGALAWVTPENKGYAIFNKEVLENQFGKGFKSIETVSNATYKSFDVVQPLTLRDGTLVKTATGKTTYVISKGKRRPIESQKTFDAYGYKKSNVITISSQTLKLHPEGKKLTLKKKKKAATAVKKDTATKSTKTVK